MTEIDIDSLDEAPTKAGQVAPFSKPGRRK